MVIVSTALLAAVLAAAPPAAPDDAITLRTVKYPDYLRVVSDLKGKVVVVDFWGEF